MRLYSLGNMYLGGVQAGIQCQHCTAELFVKYFSKLKDGDVKHFEIMDWASNHKTTILLNGGNHNDLLFLSNMLKSGEYPFAVFREDSDSLNNAITNVCVIVPEKIYKYFDWLKSQKKGFFGGINKKKLKRDGKIIEYTEFDIWLANELKNKRLMH